MWNFRLDDLVAQTHHAIMDPLKNGIVIESNKGTFTIKWVSYNKIFFMEKEESIYSELNKVHLLTSIQAHRMNTEAGLSLLNSNYSNDKQKEKT